MSFSFNKKENNGRIRIRRVHDPQHYRVYDHGRHHSLTTHVTTNVTPIAFEQHVNVQQQQQQQQQYCQQQSTTVTRRVTNKNISIDYRIYLLTSAHNYLQHPLFRFYIVFWFFFYRWCAVLTYLVYRMLLCSFDSCIQHVAAYKVTNVISPTHNNQYSI